MMLIMQTMKLFLLALVSALAGAAHAGRPVARKNIKLGNRKLRRGDKVTEALLKKAIPYKKKFGGRDQLVSRRRLDEEEFEIDGSYSIKFARCLEVKTMDEDLFDEDIVAYVQSGDIVAAKSYILFHVCQDDACYYDSYDDLYLVDLATYIGSVALYHANYRTDYCEQCEQFVSRRSKFKRLSGPSWTATPGGFDATSQSLDCSKIKG